MVEYGYNIEEEVKAMQSEMKKNIQGTNSEGKETGTQINDLEQKEEKNIQLVQKEEKRIPKNEERLRNKPLGQPEMFQYLNYRGARRRTAARS